MNSDKISHPFDPFSAALDLSNYPELYELFDKSFQDHKFQEQFRSLIRNSSLQEVPKKLPNNMDTLAS